MINFDINEDIFDGCLIYTNMPVKNNSSVQTFSEMKRLYLMLREYEQLCADYKICIKYSKGSLDYTGPLVEKRLKELQDNIKKFYVLDTTTMKNEESSR